MRPYVDGELIAQSDWRGGLGASSGGAGDTEPIVLGASNSSSGGRKEPANAFIQGCLDDVRSFGRALDPEEVTLLAAGR